MDYWPPPSRLSWNGDVARLVAGRDLSGYGALVDSHGRVIDVGPAYVLLADYEEASCTADTSCGLGRAPGPGC